MKNIIRIFSVMIFSALILGICSFSASAWDKKCDDCAESENAWRGSGKCAACDGTGVISCGNKNCKDGRIKCTLCLGSGKIKCNKCSGKDPSCKTCGGKGTVNCALCLGSGEKDCPNCSDCAACSGTGKCQACDGTGIIDMGKWKESDEKDYPEYSKIYGKERGKDGNLFDYPIEKVQEIKSIAANISEAEDFPICENADKTIAFYIPFSSMKDEEKKNISVFGDDQLKFILSELRALCSEANVSVPEKIEGNDDGAKPLIEVDFKDVYRSPFKVRIELSFADIYITSGDIYAYAENSGELKMISEASANGNSFSYLSDEFSEDPVLIIDAKPEETGNIGKNADEDEKDTDEEEAPIYFNRKTIIIAVLTGLTILLIGFYMVWACILNKKYLKSKK